MRQTLRETIMWRVFDDVSYIDEAIVEAYRSERDEVQSHLIREARSRVASVRLVAHLVAGYFGEDDPFTTILRALHVELSLLVTSVVGFRR